MKSIIKVLTCLILASLLFSAVSSADIPSDLKLPASLGTVKDVFSNAAGTGKTIIEIQDAHCNYEAQKKLAAILEYLIKEHKITLVMVEGGTGEIGLSFLRGYSDKQTRTEIAEKYLKMGQISGEEYLDIVSDCSFDLYGVEDEDLYNSNLEAFLSTDSARQQGLKDLQQIAQVVEVLKGSIYGPGLQAFEAKKKQFDSKEIGLADYGEFLRQQAQASGLRMEAEHLTAFLDSLSVEKKLDFKLAEKERNDCIKQLGGMLDQASVQALIAKTRDFTAGSIKPEEFYAYLRSLAAQRFNLAATYPNLDSYIKYLTSSKGVKADSLVREIGILEKQIRKGICSTADERSLAGIDSQLQLAAKFLKLELTPEEYAYFLQDKGMCRTSSWMAFLGDACSRYGIGTIPAASDAMDDNFDKLDSFYRLGVAREKAFIKNISQKLALAGNTAAVLITGGFHTEGVNRLLKEAGYSYAVITPAVSQKSDPAVYFSVLRAERAEAVDVSDSED